MHRMPYVLRAVRNRAPKVPDSYNIEMFTNATQLLLLSLGVDLISAITILPSVSVSLNTVIDNCSLFRAFGEVFYT